MLESRLEASLGRCWAWSSKPVVRHFVSRVGSTPTSFRHYMHIYKLLTLFEIDCAKTVSER